MSDKPKILFVFDHPQPDWWMDGLWAALNILEEDFDIEKLNLRTHDYPSLGAMHELVGGYDFTLGWGAFGSAVDKFISGEGFKSGLCIAGNAFPPTNANSYDVLFYETKWYYPQIAHHARAIHAFGINSDLFGVSSIPHPVVWDYIGVGALADWKRWHKMIAKAKGGKRCLVVGEMQQDNAAESMAIANTLLYNGVMVSPQVNPYDLVNLYYWSRTLYMPSDIFGGGERAVWEAKACDRQVEIEEDNPKLKELVESEVKDHHHYARQLKKGILECLTK